MVITLSWPIIAIALFVLITQGVAWTRDDTPTMFFPTERDCAILFATLLDVVFILFVGGVWIW